MTIVLITLFGLMLIGVPVAFAILSSGIIYLFQNMQDPLIMAQRMVSGLNSFTLLAVPLFILVGDLMDKGGISKRLTDWARSILGGLPGGMGVVAIVSCAIFAALTGSGPATVAAIGSIMIPAMLNDGYSKGTAAGLVASAGALGPIIPPSIPMIIYGVTMNLSIPAMFVAGIVPGLLIALVLCIINVIMVAHDPQAMAHQHKTKFDLKYSLKCLWKALGALGLPVLILGGIYGGIFTPTESAAIGVVYALVVGFFYRELKIRDLPKILIKSAKVSAMVNIIIAAASLFSWVVAKSRVADALKTWFVGLVHGSQPLYLLILVLILIVVGCLMDNIAATLILAPIFIPIGIALGCDPLHIGMLFCITLVVGFVTPPFGYNLFTAASLTGLNYKEIVKGSLPFLTAELLLLFVFAYVPIIITWLPRLMGF